MQVKAFSASAFKVLDTEREGGMSRIKKVELLETGELCALKYPKYGSHEDSAAASFNRELSALSNLSHRNIVNFLGIGTDGTNRFLALEWLEETLLDRINSFGAFDWFNFYELIGRPLLEGIQYAHSKNYVHRDLKPLNVMFNAKGIPKITDFGIAKEQNDLPNGVTFKQVGTPPWTPLEMDDYRHSQSRDLYSWAAICLACLTGRITYRTVIDFRNAAQNLGPTAPIQELLSCLSDDPAGRPQVATALLWDLDDFHQKRLSNSELERLLGVELSPTVHRKLEDLIPEGQSSEERINTLISDFTIACEVSGTADGGMEFCGLTFSITASRASIDSPWLLVKDVRPASVKPASIPGFPLKVRFINRVDAVDIVNLRINLNFLETFLETFIAKEQEAQKRQDEERYLIMLQDILLSRMRALRDLPSIEYFDGKWEGGAFSVSVNSEESLPKGDQRIIRYAGGILVFEVTGWTRRRVNLRPVGNRKGNPPSEGLLQVDTLAQRRAFERQDDAIKNIRADLAVLPGLRQLILSPSSAESPEKSERPAVEGLSSDKNEVVNAALGLRQIMVVQGPPGTGKTKLISEVVRRFLYEHPGSRILLAAQTHIAVDHVLEKLLEDGEKGGRIVRIARTDEDKVSEKAKKALLQYCLVDWCKAATERSKLFIQNRGQALGFNVQDVELSVRAEALLLACSRQRRIDGELKASRLRLIEAETGVVGVAEIGEIESATIATLSVAELELEHSRLAESIIKLREELQALGKDGEALADQDEESLKDWKLILDRTEPEWLIFRKELELQVAWLDLLGQIKQFEEIVLRSASVVAGTCIGLGSSEAFTKTRFDLCIIDEASKAAASEALVPMVRSEKFLIVGDPHQLAPFDRGQLDVEGYAEGELKETLLDYLIPRLPKTCVYELTHQHRMCKGIGELISHAFYEKKLINERPDVDRLPWIKKKYPKPVLWIDTQGWPQRKIGRSFINKHEQQVIIELLARLQHGASRAKTPTSVAVIAGYAAQANELDNLIQRSSLTSLSIEVATVDSFQGREADICIFSVTLSNSVDYLGFLRSVERLNVALSRPKDLLVIVGAQQFCYSVEGKNPFRKVIDFIEAHSTTCETLDASK